MAMSLLVTVFIVSVATAGPAGEPIHSVEFHPVVPYRYQRTLQNKPTLVGDRFEYWSDDWNGQFLVLFPEPKAGLANARLAVDLHRVANGGKSRRIAGSETRATSRKASFLIRVKDLKPARYRLLARLLTQKAGDTPPPQTLDFVKSDRRNPVVRVPEEGLPIVVEKQDILADAVWPVRVGVPLPIEAVPDPQRLALFEDGRQVPCQIATRATWCPKGSAKWVHLDFGARYAGGTPSQYRLRMLRRPSVPKTDLVCEEKKDKIVVDNGHIRFEVGRKRFAGIETAWFDPSGAGDYDRMNPVIKGPGGPYLRDSRMIDFDSVRDDQVEVTVEEKGPYRVTVCAKGWYTNPAMQRYGEKGLCKFATRMTAFAGHPTIRISHETTITYDTRLYRLADLGFRIAHASAERFAIGADGRSIQGRLPKSPETVFLHQDRHDHFRVVGAGKKPIEGKRSDGWFSAILKRGGVKVSILMKDVWQKFPKEVQLGADGASVHFWPAHGHRAFSLEEELARENIYKFWCFHQHPLLDLNLPNDYYEKLKTDYWNETYLECQPHKAYNGNGQGLVIGNEFAIVFSAKEEEIGGMGLTENIPALARLYQHDPAASSTPEWNCSTRALGNVAPVDAKRFGEMEAAVEKGFLSYARALERGNEYGMWNYADTHTYWNPAGNHARLHRVWHNSHYHEAGMTWLMYYRSGSPDLLRWARVSTDHYMNVDTINYHDPERRIRSHTTGAMYHCKALTHWGSEAYGTKTGSSHAGLWGHWVDPDASLWCWYISGRPRAWDAYNTWAGTIRRTGTFIAGGAREVNTSLACAVNFYEATWEPWILPMIHGMGHSLRTSRPLEKQYPGPMWHPLWMNRYYRLTRDPEYPPFILKYARRVQFFDTWTTALAALAYELSGDKSYLTAHFDRVNSFPLSFYRREGHPYDWYGMGPGPLGSRWGAYFCWGHFLHALNQAGMDRIEPSEETPGAYPLPVEAIVALEETDGPFEWKFSATSLGGDLHPITLTLFAPDGKPVGKMEGNHRQRSGVVEVAADGKTGLYRTAVRVHEAHLYSPLTSLPHEAALLPKNKRSYSRGINGYLSPVGENDVVNLEFASGRRISAGRACNILLEDANGKLVLRRSLFRDVGDETHHLRLDPKETPAPWKIRAYGLNSIKWTGSGRGLLLAPRSDSIAPIQKTLAEGAR